MAMLPITTAKKESINNYYVGHGIHLHQQIAMEEKGEEREKTRNAKMRFIKIKKMHVPLGVQPRRTINYVNRRESSRNVKRREKASSTR